jgi:hypothetical protein
MEREMTGVAAPQFDLIQVVSTLFQIVRSRAPYPGQFVAERSFGFLPQVNIDERLRTYLSKKSLIDVKSMASLASIAGVAPDELRDISVLTRQLSCDIRRLQNEVEVLEWKLAPVLRIFATKNKWEHRKELLRSSFGALDKARYQYRRIVKAFARVHGYVPVGNDEMATVTQDGNLILSMKADDIVSLGQISFDTIYEVLIALKNQILELSQQSAHGSMLWCNEILIEAYRIKQEHGAFVVNYVPPRMETREVQYPSDDPKKAYDTWSEEYVAVREYIYVSPPRLPSKPQ